MFNIKAKLHWIDRRVGYYRKLLVRIIREGGNPNTVRVDFLLKTALRVAFLYDFYYETGAKDYRRAAAKYKRILYTSVSSATKKSLQQIERRIMRLFHFERLIWSRARRGQKIPNKDIIKFWRMKSADSKFYGKIVQIFSRGKSFARPLYAFTLLQDIYLDVVEYEADHKGHLPNMICLKLGQAFDRFPGKKSLAIKWLHDCGGDRWFNEQAREIIKGLSAFDFGRCRFLETEIMRKYRQVQGALR